MWLIYGSDIKKSVEVGSLSHYLQGFIDPRWCRISSINSMFHYLQCYVSVRWK